MNRLPTFATRPTPGSQLVRVAHDVEVVRGGDGRTIHGIPCLGHADAGRRCVRPIGSVGAITTRRSPGAFPDAVANPSRVKFSPTTTSDPTRSAAVS